jgi:HD-GYP domain-containing protein (c-di-GMP phosphodiesterase class II)
MTQNAHDAEPPSRVSLATLGRPAQEVLRSVDRSCELLETDGRFSSYGAFRAHPLIALVRSGTFGVLIAPACVWDHGRSLLSPYAERIAGYRMRLILLGSPSDPELARAQQQGVCALVSAEPSADEMAIALAQAFELMDVKERSESRGKWLNRYRYELGELIEIARAITTEREIDKLLALILEKSRFVTGADAGSIYVVEGNEADLSRRTLRFKLSQNDSVHFDSREFTMPISPRSMAGYVAIERRTVNIEDVYDLPAGSTFGFDRSFDERTGYRTRSIISTPLVSSKGAVIGVLQLINKKREPKARLKDPAEFDSLVIPFDDRSEQLLETLAAQAGIALENAMLYEEIRGLFEGFVEASVDAIEARDPTTSGHSRRVAQLTVGLAHAVERVDAGPFKEVVWSREDIREIQYASLLHDFGKIGVREHVLVKAKKLFPQDLRIIRMRFDFVIRTLEAELFQRKLRAMERSSSREELEALDREFEGRRKDLEDSWQRIVAANEPTVLKAGDFQRIEDVGRITYTELSGETTTLLTPAEVHSLSVPKGSLTPHEFEEIRSHVSHTYRFLAQIPWGKSFSRVAIIAGAHHERLNGTGYPNRLRAEEIPLQSKMMSISDIFDALTASDRPYKRAVPVDKALDILGYEVKDGHVDGELVRIFVESKPWEASH